MRSDETYPIMSTNYNLISRPSYIAPSSLSNSNQKEMQKQQSKSTFYLPLESSTSKMFSQAFFQNVVQQMKSTVRNTQTPNEPELIRYKAVQQVE